VIDREQPGADSTTHSPKRINARAQAALVAARYHGAELDPSDCVALPGESPTKEALTDWLRGSGLWVCPAQLHWRDLVKLRDAGPIILLFTDGGAGLTAGANAAKHVVFIKDPEGRQTIPVDELRLSQVWSGEALLVRAGHGANDGDRPFSIGYLIHMVLGERRSLRDIGIASLTLSFLTIFPPLLVMTVVDRVLTHHSQSTLTLLTVILGIGIIYETLLSHARRLLTLIVGTKIDTKLNLHVYNRLLRLGLDYFERHPAGETMHKIGHVYKIREFLTGKLLSTFLDLITLVVLLPFLFYLSGWLAAMVVAATGLIMLVIFASLRPLRAAFAGVAEAESQRSSTLGETIFGIKTIKSLALEPQRKSLWDERVAMSATSRVAFGRLANWPQTIIIPLERFMSVGVVLVGAYMALSDTSGYATGALFAFMMLSTRVAQPLVGLAKLFEDYEEVGAAVSECASVLNRPLEPGADGRGLRPTIKGALSFENVHFTYPGAKTPALDGVSFSVAAGGMLGIVGRSGSGKSTIARLLGGISTDYDGAVKVDGHNLREVNLRHLRRNFGVVLQDSFLFRGTVRENLIASRPNLTLADAVRAASLTGADEFIENMAQGYETLVEEGSPNLSGGQRQRLAIARSLITNPPVLILDEPTSALDPESEAVVNANILRVGRGRTTVIVSHRLSSLTHCDNILVMDKGKVVDLAPHRILLERCTLYRMLWAQQTKHLDYQQGPRHEDLVATDAQNDHARIGPRRYGALTGTYGWRQ
jgi:ATP-binding cassette subfamily B protein